MRSSAIIAGVGLAGVLLAAATARPAQNQERLPLPTATRAGRMSVEEALSRRRSLREFAKRPLTQNEIGQLLWAAQGVTDGQGRRTAPSAGAVYPLETYVATAEGFFRYDPHVHALRRISERDLRRALHQAAGEQDAVRNAPAVFVLAADYRRATVKYDNERAHRYVLLEAGHAAQNLMLQAVSLGLGSVGVGAFDDARVQRVLALPKEEAPLYLLPVGEER